jgi:hypothetical protein
MSTEAPTMSAKRFVLLYLALGVLALVVDKLT